MKYSDYTEQYYMRMAVNIDTAVRNTLREVICANTVLMIATVFAGDIKRAVRQVKRRGR